MFDDTTQPTVTPGYVKCDISEPVQCPTSRKLRTQCDYYARVMLKHPYLSEFHCYPELLHAALLEADRTVVSYVPQPFRMWVGNRRYTPDVYVVCDGRRRQVIELKPRGEMEDELKDPLERYFARNNMQFVVVDHDAILARRIEAENWLQILQILIQAANFPTDPEEEAIITRLSNRSLTLGDIADRGNRDHTYLTEVALFRLTHKGLVASSNISEYALGYDTEFRLCD